MKLSGALFAFACFGLPSLAAADDVADCKGQDADVAISACTRVLNSGKLNAQGRAGALSYRASSYAKRGKYEVALRDNTQAIRLSPQYADAYASRCSVYIYKGEFAPALADCSK